MQMAIVMVRVVLMPQRDAAEARQIVLDLKMDEESGSSSGPFPAFGRVGDFRAPETLYPFTLMFDGRMDYGAYARDDQRQDMIEIRKAPIAEGEEIAYRAGEQSFTYVIASVTRLIE
jgi:hypothetical protein